MSLQFYKPNDTGGTEVYQFSLFINDGNDLHDPTTLVTSYTSNSLVHTLNQETTDTYLVPGKIYKFRFRATNVIGNSQLSDIVRYALAD